MEPAINMSFYLKPVIFLLVWLLLWLPIAWLIGKRWQWRPFQVVAPEHKLPLLLSLYGLAPVVIAAGMQLEQASWADYGLQWTLQEGKMFGLGMAIAIGGLGGVYAQQIQGQWVQWQPSQLRQWGQLIPVFFLLATVIAGVEELIFQGIFFVQLHQQLPYWLAVGIISTGFSLLHLLWERRITYWQLPGLWLLGIVLGVAYWCDGNHLGLAWGLHSGWVLGLASTDATGLVTYPDTEGNYWVGRGNQPLAGLAGLLCVGLTGVVMILIKLSGGFGL